MSCSSCSTTKDGKPGGCRSNGTCGTGGCNKLNVFNWLSDMALPSGQQPFDVVEVRFKGSRKEFYRNKESLALKTGDVVAVESTPGHDIGVVSLAGELVRFQLKKKGVTDNSEQIRSLYRKAKQNEIEKWHEVKALEASTLSRTRTIIQHLRLSMKLSDVEFQGDGKKATFYYTADDRVDFRELIKKLAEEFHIRIEMRQIGMRQEASRLGGIGSCGRELCCATWLTDFKTVSTSAARYQNLALNPAKLAGQCGKLKCCLNYELDSYLDTLKDFPNTSISIETEKGKASHRKTDIFKRLMWYAYDQGENKEGREYQEGAEGGNWIPLSVDRVKEIIELNKKQVKPVDLKDFEEEEEIDTAPDFENVVGQDRIDRMDKKGKRKKKKKKKVGSPADQQQQQGQQPAQGQQQQGQRPQNRPQHNKPQQQQQGRPQQNKPQQPQQQRNQQANRNPGQQGQQGGQQQQKNRPQRQQPPKNNPPAPSN